MNDAFVPRPFIFAHCCANCKYARKILDERDVSKIYKCLRYDHEHLLSGAHICDVDLDEVGDQITWFEEMRT